MDLLTVLETRPLLVGDGAMGSQLIDRGLPADVPGELWNLERADIIASIQRAYAEAGADYLITNTFGANSISLARHGIEDQGESINQAAVQIARKAGGNSVVILGGLGPTGGLVEPLGDLDERTVSNAYAAQVRALASAGSNAIVAETFESSQEAALALKAAREECDLPLILSMKLSPARNGDYRSMMGEGPEKLVKTARECDCAVVGTNCGHGIASMAGLVGRIAGLTDLPVIAQPNAGQPELVEGKTVYHETAETFAQHLEELYEAGAKIIGGCCGTSPSHVQVVSQFADDLQRKA